MAIIKPSRRKLTALIAFSLSPLASALRDSHAQTNTGFPSKPIRLVVGFTPGGGVDINARLLAAKLTELMGVAVLVENKPGAGTNIANDFVAKAPADGHTLLINTGAVAINMSLYKKLPFDTLRDFAPVSVFSESQNILVTNATKPIRSVRELVELAKAKPGALSYASAGSGSTQHLGAELFKLKTNTDILHVPYKGSAPAITALIAGEVDMVFINVPAILAHVRSERLWPLAALGPRRAEQLPEVPTLKEAGVDGVELVVWYGVLAPAGTPSAIVNQLSVAIAKVAQSSEIRGKLAEQGADAVGSTPEAFGLLLKEEVARWAAVIKSAGIQAD
jgi:tripartite-type tricarboxylate transporter receptor subunit TctC